MFNVSLVTIGGDVKVGPERINRAAVAREIARNWLKVHDELVAERELDDGGMERAAHCVIWGDVSGKVREVVRPRSMRVNINVER